MSDKTDLVGLGVVALVGYFLIKKINDLGTSAVNTATDYVEETVEKVATSVRGATDTAKSYVHGAIDTVKSYIPGTTTDSDKAYQEYKQTVQDINKGVAAVSGFDCPTSRYLYNAGGGYTDLKTGAYIPGAVTNPADDLDSLNKYTGSAGSNKATVQSKVDNVVRVNPTKQTTETSAFTLEMPDYMAAAGNSKSTGSSSTGKTTTVKALPGGYSVARESGTTVNAGRYAPIKVKVKR